VSAKEAPKQKPEASQINGIIIALDEEHEMSQGLVLRVMSKNFTLLV
jgi:hypothetical protein